MGTVTQIHPRETPATPDPDAPAAARYFLRQGWTALDAFHAGLGLEVCAAMWVIEAADEAGPSCPA